MAQLSKHFQLGRYKRKVEEAVAQATRNNLVERIWKGDYTLWGSYPQEITNRLGWLTSHQSMVSQLKDLESFREEVMEEGIQHVVLLGMGGSSLAPELFQRTFGKQEGCCDLTVLDSTDPWRVAQVAAQADSVPTLFIVSTKSGGTVETLSFFKFFFSRLQSERGKEGAGKYFTAITDPASSLEELSRQYCFRETFLNDPNIGGRYSVFSHFGLVPAMLLGVDVSRLLEGAGEAARAFQKGEGDALALGVAVSLLAKEGKDKLTFLVDPSCSGFGDWVEQLIAESTGKNGTGILPVVGEGAASPESYGSDRVFVCIAVGDDTAMREAVLPLIQASHPVVFRPLQDPYELGRELFDWMAATAVAGHFLGINPFDQPDVEAAKKSARRMTQQYLETGSFPEEQPVLSDGTVEVYADVPYPDLTSCLAGFFGSRSPGSYLSIHAYLPPRQSLDDIFTSFRKRVRDRFQMATTVGYGPRFLHSTGQLHKGDAGKGLFLQCTCNDLQDFVIPEDAETQEGSLSFGTLKAAQARGDREELLSKGRRVVRIHLGNRLEEGLEYVLEKIASMP